MTNRGFGTFWVGERLSAFEQACLNSFVAAGKSLTLFSFEPIQNLPENVQAGDARDIVSADYLDAFLYKGKPHMGHFADLFRYEMIAKAGLIWIDADILLLDSTCEVWSGANIFGYEIGGGFNGAILYFSKPELVSSLQSEVRKLMYKELRWGETGPLLLDRLLATEDLKSQAQIHEIFYPIHYDEIGRAFLPEYFEWCSEKCRDAVTVHIFNNVIIRTGYWKEMAPPVGSYLYENFKKSDGLRFFSGVFPETVMKHIVMNFSASQTGTSLGIKSIIKQAIPSIRRTLESRFS